MSDIYIDKNDIVTLDGPSGAGKSSVSKMVADMLGYKHLDTGATYRATTLYVLQNDLDISNRDAVMQTLDKINISFDTDGRVYLNEVDVTVEIRSEDVVRRVSEVSAMSAIREGMVSLQRAIASYGGYVVDGRDIGSVVFPNARYKFYIDASLEERARRRYEEEKSRGGTLSFSDVKVSIASRDEFDSQRELSPLVIPENAHVIDTTQKTIDDVAYEITKVILNIKNRRMPN